jgi:hypothetical protein
VDAKTHDPIELIQTVKGGTMTTRFLVYERLPLNERTRALLDLTAQHPSARISHDQRAWLAAVHRFIPHG